MSVFSHAHICTYSELSSSREDIVFIEIAPFSCRSNIVLPREFYALYDVPLAVIGVTVDASNNVAFLNNRVSLFPYLNIDMHCRVQLHKDDLTNINLERSTASSTTCSSDSRSRTQSPRNDDARQEHAQDQLFAGKYTIGLDLAHVESLQVYMQDKKRACVFGAHYIT